MIPKKLKAPSKRSKRKGKQWQFYIAPGQDLKYHQLTHSLYPGGLRKK